jgi:NADH-quinone oxidoreductase subunit H
MLWFTAKVIAIIFAFVWLRGTLPRLRYDQFMAFGWKMLIPINLVWILAVTSIHVLRDRNWPAWEATIVPLAFVLLLIVVPGLMIWEGAAARRAGQDAEDEEDAAQERPTFPTPPMDLTIPTPPRRLATASVSRPAAELPGTRSEVDTDG